MFVAIVISTTCETPFASLGKKPQQSARHVIPMGKRRADSILVAGNAFVVDEKIAAAIDDQTAVVDFDWLDVMRDQIERLYDEAVAAKNQIIRANLRLVVSIAKRYVSDADQLFDRISEGNESLMRDTALWRFASITPNYLHHFNNQDHDTEFDESWQPTDCRCVEFI